MHHRSLPNLFACLMIFLAAVVLLLTDPFRAAARPMLQDDLPTEGWTVCMDGGIQFIPEVGETRQVFDICHGMGWRYQAYCTQPSVPVPAVGAFCSLFSGDTLWCGEGVQQLQLYAILQTPQPTATPTSTATLTATSTMTATPTSTSTGTPTITFTPTGTPLPLIATSTSTITAELPTETPSILHTFLPGDDRPRPGGPGNVEAVGALAAAGIVTATMLTLALRWRKPGRA